MSLSERLGARFEGITSLSERRNPKPFASLLSLSMKEGETLRAYSDCNWELYNEIRGDNGAIAASTFKMGFSLILN